VAIKKMGYPGAGFARFLGVTTSAVIRAAGRQGFQELGEYQQVDQKHRPDIRTLLGLPLLYGCVITVSFLVTRNCSIVPLAGTYDSLRYLGMAETMTRGEWLGDYNVLTLIRLPVYSMFLALNGLSGLPLHLVQQAFYLLSAGTLAAALRICGVGRFAAFAAFAVCALHPAGLYPMLFVATEAIYLSLATCMLAGYLGLMGSFTGSSRGYAFWLLIASFSLCFCWHTRPESIWIVPFVVVFVLCLAFRIKETVHGISKRVLLVRAGGAIFCPVLTAVLIGTLISSLNEKHYGIRVTNEIAEPEFERFGHWLTRLAPDARRPHVPVSTAALAEAYDISLSAARLQPFFSGDPRMKGWLAAGRSWMGISDELAGGWSLWALRDAADSIGMYESANKARSFYRRAAHEIEQACRTGEAECTWNPTGNLLAPFLTWSDGGRLAYSFIKMTAKAVLMEDLVQGLETVNAVKAAPELVERYDKITHDQRDTAYLQLDFESRYHALVFVALHLLGISLLVLRFYCGARGALSSACQHESGRSSMEFDVLATAGLLSAVLILSRLALITYIDAMSFYAQLRYLLPVYPAFFALITVVYLREPATDHCEKEEV
jgi:hypothetical protein